MSNQINRAIARVIGEVLGAHYFSHRKIESRLHEAGFTGDPPEGNCSDKITNWIVREAAQFPNEISSRVGEFLSDYMDSDYLNSETGKERIHKILNNNGFTYETGGRLFGGSLSVPAKSLEDHLKQKSIPEINLEFERALKSVDSDPPAAITAACCILESFCRVYLQEEQITPPSDQSAKPLWNAVAKHLGLSPSDHTDQNIKKILSGFYSVVDGIAALRTHDGSAHGRERRGYRLDPRHARLAVHAAHTLVLFALESWEAAKSRL